MKINSSVTLTQYPCHHITLGLDTKTVVTLGCVTADSKDLHRYIVFFFISEAYFLTNTCLVKIQSENLVCSNISCICHQSTDLEAFKLYSCFSIYNKSADMYFFEIHGQTKKKLIIIYLKLQSVTFTSLSPSMFENLELQFLAELSSVRGVVARLQRGWI